MQWDWAATDHINFGMLLTDLTTTPCSGDCECTQGSGFQTVCPAGRKQPVPLGLGHSLCIGLAADIFAVSCN